MPAVELEAMSNILWLIWGQEYQSHPINRGGLPFAQQERKGNLTIDNWNLGVKGSGCQVHSFRRPCYCSVQGRLGCRWNLGHAKESSSISSLLHRPWETGNSCSIPLLWSGLWLKANSMVGFHAEAGLNPASCTVRSVSVCVTEFKSDSGGMRACDVFIPAV